VRPKGKFPLLRNAGNQQAVFVTEKPLAFFSKKTAGHRYAVIALLENEPAGN
jgi:hypothetical protein